MRGKLVQLAILVIILISTSHAWATTYYIDWVNGADTNDGITKSTPWKRAPGMYDCTSNCLTKQKAGGKAGDQFILKGGVTWPRAALSWDWYFGSGSQTSPIYFGVDQTWYSGNSWSRPVLDAGNGVPNASSQGVKAMMRVYGEWFIVDNIEFKGLAQLNDSDPSVPQVLSLGSHSELKNCYFHGWSHGGTATHDNMVVVGSALINEGPDMYMQIHDNVWDGSDTTNDMAMAYKGSAGQLYNNYVAYMRNAFVGSFLYVWGNTFVHMNASFDPTSHGNVVENTGGQLIIYNNYISHSNGGATIFHTPKDGKIDYCFNNVIVSQQNQAIQIDNNGLLTGSGSGIYVFNNTIQSPNGFSATPINGPVRSGYPNLPFMTVRNNHLIADNPSVNFGSKVTAKTESKTVGRTNPQAKSDGYLENEPYPYVPPGGSAITIGAGEDLSALCSTIPSIGPYANASVACLSETTVGVGYDPVNRVVIVPSRVSMQRGSIWDVGAYSSTDSLAPQPPQKLRNIP